MNIGRGWFLPAPVFSFSLVQAFFWLTQEENWWYDTFIMHPGQDLKQLVREVLEDGYLMSLGTVDEQGVWVSDVIYVFDDELSIYWLSRVDARHSEAIEKNPQVAGSITTSKKEDDEAGIQFEGVAEKIDGDLLELARAHRQKRGDALPEREGEILEERGQSWYRLTPTRIELIYESLFGKERQRV